MLYTMTKRIMATQGKIHKVKYTTMRYKHPILQLCVIVHAQYTLDHFVPQLLLQALASFKVLGKGLDRLSHGRGELGEKFEGATLFVRTMRNVRPSLRANNPHYSE